MKKLNNSKDEFSNNESNISFEKDNSKGEISKDNSSKDNDFKIWGKLQSYSDMQSGRVEGYLFTEYENLKDAKDLTNGYHQVKRYISLAKDQIKASVSPNGTFGILSFKDNVYSFIPSINDITLQERNIVTSSCAAAETQNKANTDVKTSTVDNYTTTVDKTLKTPLKCVLRHLRIRQLLQQMRKRLKIPQITLHKPLK